MFYEKEGLLCHFSWICKIFHDYQVTRPAIERDEVDRAVYKMLVGEHFQPYHFVFADETHFNRLSLRRPWAWAPRGSRARRRECFIQGQR